MKCDGKVFSGEPTSIIKQMQRIAFIDPMTTDEYIDFVARMAEQMENVQLKISGRTTEERAKSLISEMVRTGLALYSN